MAQNKNKDIRVYGNGKTYSINTYWSRRYRCNPWLQYNVGFDDDDEFIDAIEYLLLNPEAASQMGVNARVTAESLRLE